MGKDRPEGRRLGPGDCCEVEVSMQGVYQGIPQVLPVGSGRKQEGPTEALCLISLNEHLCRAC